MVELFRCEDDALLGSVTEDDLQFLVDTLVEEDSEDTDYFIDRDTLDYLRSEGASEALLTLLERGLEGRDDMELYYSEG